MTREEYRTINCPACGASITLTGPQTRCPYCGSVVDRPEPETPAVQIHLSTPEIQQPAAPTRARSCAVSLVALGVVILAGAGALVFLLLTPGQSPDILVHLSRNVQGPAIPVPTDRQGPADVLLFTSDKGSSQHFLTYLDGAKRTPVWDSPSLSNDVYRAGVVVGGGKVYVADGAALLALNRGDGSEAWRTNLSDSIASYCHGCVLLVNGYLVALSQDGVLQAYEAESGRPAWSERLNETPRNLWAVNGTAAVLDYDLAGEVDSVVLQLRDPASGKVVQRLPGRCTGGRISETLPIYDPNVLVSPPGDVYFLFGLLPGCVQRWDAATGQMAWQTVAEDHYFDRFTASPFLADGVIYGSYGGRIIAVNAANGELRLLADEADYELTVQGEREGLLLVLARRQRGSERYELWGLNASDGRVKWQYWPQGEEPLTSAGGWAADKAFDWHLTREGLAVIHLIGEPPTLVVEQLDLGTGKSTTHGTASLDDHYWSGLAWSDSTAWLTIYKIYTIDLASGQMVGTWP